VTHIPNTDRTVAVDQHYYWQPIATCPHGLKVQLLGRGGVAIYSTWHGDEFFTHWAPLPRIPTESPAS
jgi:hypothetical protein